MAYAESLVVHVLTGECRDVLARLDANSVQTVVTSPPYYSLRDYDVEPSVWGGDAECGHAFVPYSVEAYALPGGAVHLSPTADTDDSTSGLSIGAGERSSIHLTMVCRDCGAIKCSLGLEPTPELYVEHLVEVFRAVRRVLRDDGTVWLNLGDSYHGGGYGNHAINGDQWRDAAGLDRRRSRQQDLKRANPHLKPKDLIGIPWAAAFALRTDGWYLRKDIIWDKPSCLPESVQDRPTSSHEYLFLLSKSASYFYDANAIREPGSTTSHGGEPIMSGPKFQDVRQDAGVLGLPAGLTGRNKRSVWRINPEPYPGAHFAVMPMELVKPCIKAGSSEYDVVLDPFAGSGTVGVVAQALRRDAILIDANPSYADLMHERLRGLPVSRTRVVEANLLQPTLFDQSDSDDSGGTSP